MRGRRFAALAMGMVLCAVAGARATRADEHASPIVLETPDGSALTLAVGPEDPPLLLHFWASWCPECDHELPVLGAALAGCAGTAARVYLVNVGDSADVARAFLAERGVHASLALDPKGAVWRRFTAKLLPANATFVAGELRRESGPRDGADWRRRLAELGCRDAGTEPSAP